MRENKMEYILMLLLGIFSSLQVLQIFDITIFTYIISISFIYFLFTKKINFKKNKIVILMLIISFLTTILTKLNTDFNESYSKNAILGFVNYMFVFVIYMCINDIKDTFYFIKGFRISCYIQLCWAVVQYIMAQYFNIDFNKVVFNDFLKYSGEFSTYRNGKPVCSGLHWHPANLIPIVVFLFLFEKSILCKFFCLVVTYYSYSATMYIALMLCVAYYFYRFINDLIYKKKKITYIHGIVFVFVVLISIFGYDLFFSKVINAVSMLINRILQIKSTVGGTSSAVHFNYYTSLNDIFDRNSIISKFFGVGFSSSGIFFSKYYGQYNDIVWVVESDFVNILLNQGIIGFCLFYYYLISNAIKRKKSNPKVMVYVFIILICGITYNLQFYWVILLELILFKHFSYAGNMGMRGKENAAISNNCDLSS